MNRKINFGAGPAGMPVSVLEEANKNFVDFAGTGMSLLEHSHRGKDYDKVHQETLDLLTELLALPKSHGLVLVQGGASLQFAMIPMNFLPAGKSADYLVTGHWANLAYGEAAKVGSARKAYDGAPTKYVKIPSPSECALDPRAAYVHITTNNTIFGSQWASLPDTKGVPLVVDASSDILSRPLDASRCHLLYGGAQKNLGPAGLAVVAVNLDWMKDARKDIPDILSYAAHHKARSIFHTPPTFAVYLMGLQLKWIKANGGAAGMAKRNDEKAALLYGAIDASGGYYNCPVEKSSRSKMNVIFRLPTPALDDAFCDEAEKANLTGLKGHRSAGGIRASIYNAASAADVKALAAFMSDFQKKNG